MTNRVGENVIEYLNGTALRFIGEKFHETPNDAAGAIYFGQETSAKNEDALFEQWNGLLSKHNADLERSWFTTNEQDREKMRAFRHALPVTVNERIAKYKQRKVGTDMAVPDENFPAFLRFYKDTLDASGLEYVIFGHIGDCHLHANMIPKDATEATEAQNIYGRWVEPGERIGRAGSDGHRIGKAK